MPITNHVCIPRCATGYHATAGAADRSPAATRLINAWDARTAGRNGSISDQITHDARVCQLAAEALWQAATSENINLAWSRSPAYVALERAFIVSVRTVYGLGERRAGRVRELLAEYGPDDSLSGTSERGIASYVSYVLTNRP